jgi:hypothetical protein
MPKIRDQRGFTRFTNKHALDFCVRELHVTSTASSNPVWL